MSEPQCLLPYLLSLLKLYSSLWLLLPEAAFSVSPPFYAQRAICLPIFLYCIFLVFLFVSSIKLARALRTAAVFYVSFHRDSLDSPPQQRHVQVFGA